MKSKFAKLVPFNDTKEVNEIILDNQLIKINNISLDSTEALEKAKNYYNLKPGMRWAKGYNFSLIKSQDKIVLSVIGQDEKGYFTKVHFDFNSGKLVLGEHKVPSGGELYKDCNKILLLENESFCVVNMEVSPNYMNDKTIIASVIVNPMLAEEYPV